MTIPSGVSIKYKALSRVGRQAPESSAAPSYAMSNGVLFNKKDSGANIIVVGQQIGRIAGGE